MAGVAKNMSDDGGDDDVFFFCPACGKSMVIDGRGIGLLVDCPSCASEVLVPHESQHEPPPSLYAGSDEEAKERIASLSTALKVSQNDISKLSNSLSEVSKRRKVLEQQRASSIKTLEGITQEAAVMQAALNRVVKLLHDFDQPRDL